MQQSNYGGEGRTERLTVAAAMGDAGRRQGEVEIFNIHMTMATRRVRQRKLPRARVVIFLLLKYDP